jgi:HNH endonuclease
MPMKFCLDCGQLTDNGSRCVNCEPKFRRRQSASKGTTKSRGLGGTHRRRAEKIVQGVAVCPRCGRPPTPDNPMTAHHTVARAKGGDHDTPLVPLCRQCNSEIGDKT